MIPSLRDGTQLTDAARRLQECAGQGRSVANGSAGQSIGVHQNSCLAWVGTAESQLRNVFIDPTTWEHLYGERHWQIYQLTESSPRAIELINNDLNLQASWLDELADRLKKLADRLLSAPGQLTVLDTHVLLHFMPPKDVDWPTVVGTPQVRLVLRIPPRTPWPDQRISVAAALRSRSPSPAWPVRYAIRRCAWHVLDHAWEIEDKGTIAR